VDGHVSKAAPLPCSCWGLNRSLAGSDRCQPLCCAATGGCALALHTQPPRVQACRVQAKNDVKRGKTKSIVFGLSCKKLCDEKEQCGSRVSTKYTVRCLVASLRQRQTKLISSDLLCQKTHASDYLWQIIAKEIVPQYPRHIPDLYIMKLFLLYDL